MDEKFKKWATGYSGFDGGNAKGEIWLCGIEWGGESPSCIQELEALFLEDVRKIPTGYIYHEKNLVFNYNKRFIHIIGAMKDEKFSSGDVQEKIKNLNKKEKFFTEKSNYLKLNLSPLNFPNTDGGKWDDKYEEITKFKTKSDYEKWVWTEREKLFKDMEKEYKPKLIITFGTSSNYITKYKKFFNFNEIKLTTYSYESDKRLSLKYGYKEDSTGNKTLFINTYFPSNGWLTSSKTLDETGRTIQKLLNKYRIEI